MPDDPLGQPGPDSEEELEQRFDEIEQEESENNLLAPDSAEEESNTPEGGARWPLPDDTTVEEILRLNKLEEALEQSAFEQQSAATGIEDEFELRTEALEKGGTTQLLVPPEWNFERPPIPGQKKPDAGAYLGIGVGISVAYTMVGSTLAGWLIGYLIDRPRGGAIGQAIGTLIGAVVGLVAAIFTIVRTQSNQDR